MVMRIEILGMGCPKCKALEGNARKAVSELKVKAEIVKVTDIEKIIAPGVLSTPAWGSDGKVKTAGRSPDAEEIKKWLK
jgi:small redox-active disulfide protein 2